MSWPSSFHDWHGWLPIGLYPVCFVWGWVAGAGRFLPRPRPPRD